MYIYTHTHNTHNTHNSMDILLLTYFWLKRLLPEGGEYSPKYV